MAENEVNEELRAHVTRVGFDLSLGKSHVATLVYIDQMLRRRVYFRTPMTGPYRHAFSNFAIGVHGLEDRGLLVHLRPNHRALREKYGDAVPPRLIWRITKAGKIVIELLREAGVYEDYLGALVPLSVVEEAG